MKPMMYLAGMMVGMLSVSHVHANVYHCVVDGQNVYTNKPNGNCQTAKLEKIGSYTSDKTILQRQNELNSAAAAPKPAAKPATTTTHVATANAAPNTAATATATASPQAKRDQGRREILTTELNNEKKPWHKHVWH